MYCKYILLPLIFCAPISGMETNTNILDNQSYSLIAECEALWHQKDYYNGATKIESVIELQYSEMPAQDKLSYTDLAAELNFLAQIYSHGYPSVNLPCNKEKAWQLLKKAELLFDYFQDKSLKYTILHELGRLRLYHSTHIPIIAQDPLEASVYLFNALQFAPNKPALFLDFSRYYQFNNDDAKRLDYLRKTIEHKDDDHITYAQALYQCAEMYSLGLSGMVIDHKIAEDCVKAIIAIPDNSSELTIIKLSAQSLLKM